MAFSFFPANQANALDVDLSYEDFILLADKASKNKVHMRSEKTGNYIVADSAWNGASMHFANPGDSIDLWMVIWTHPHRIHT